jgi:hypothetical protein
MWFFVGFRTLGSLPLGDVVREWESVSNLKDIIPTRGVLFLRFCVGKDSPLGVRFLISVLGRSSPVGCSSNPNRSPTWRGCSLMGTLLKIPFLVGSPNSCVLSGMIVFCPGQWDSTLCATRRPLFGLLFESDSWVPYWIRIRIPYSVIIASFGLPLVGGVSPLWVYVLS